ncbi:hypothetical protein ACIPYS_06480 [Kitasatospora sp. NPDC089913]|uniref:hypothetical protein n=1 Tax=Kitasatospora sp. NPDC089913 TaxID=3364080 RepID=UPI00382B6A2D
MFKKGDTVRIARDLFPEEGSRSFVGQTGEVAGTVGNSVVVSGLDPGSSQKYGFDPDEVEPA